MTVRLRLLFFGSVLLLLLVAANAQVCAQDSGRIPGVGPVAHSFQSGGSHNVPLIAMQWAITVWVFILGSCFGSFLNVVIYRLPAGMSLGKPKSRCPKCETPLAVKDNIPVFGWLLLRGKCRYCSLPIPMRYPGIEATCGGVFLLLMFVELLTGGANLPLRASDHFHVNPGFWLVWFMKWDLSGIYLYHCCLLITVLAATMIGFDGHRPQRKLVMFGVLVGVIAGCFFHELRPVSAMPYTDFVKSLQWGFWWTDPVFNRGTRVWTGVTLVGICDGLVGLIGGVAAGWVVRWQMLTSASTAERGVASVLAVSSALLIIGGFLGWQACGMLTLILLPLLTVCHVLDRAGLGGRFLRMSAPGTFVVLLAFLVLWRVLDDATWMIGYAGWSWTRMGWLLDWGVTLGVLFVFASVVRFRNLAVETTLAVSDSAPGDDSC